MKLKRRWNHGNGYRFNPELWKQIKENGWDNIHKEIVATNLSKEEASKIEKSEIQKHKSVDPKFGFNREAGGLLSQKVVTDSVKKRMSEATSGSKNHNYGKHFSEEHKAKISASNSGKIRSAETKERIGASKRVPVNQYEVTGALVQEWPSVKAASIGTGAISGHIVKVCKNQRKTAGGYVWRYA